MIALPLLLALAASPVPAGRYVLDVTIESTTGVPLVGKSRTESVSVVDVDAAGDVVQTLCSIVTRGRGWQVRAPASTVAVLPRPRWRFVGGSDGSVVADQGALVFGAGDDDNDGQAGVAMDLKIDALGSYRVQVMSRGSSVLVGRATKDGAEGAVDVKENRQDVLSGLPVDVDGDSRVERARFVLRRVGAQAGCP